jgi:hypothetical protein
MVRLSIRPRLRGCRAPPNVNTFNTRRDSVRLAASTAGSRQPSRAMGSTTNPRRPAEVVDGGLRRHLTAPGSPLESDPRLDLREVRETRSLSERRSRLASPEPPTPRCPSSPASLERSIPHKSSSSSTKLIPVSSEARSGSVGVGRARDGPLGSSRAAMYRGSRPMAALRARIDRPARSRTSRRWSRNSSSGGISRSFEGSIEPDRWLLQTSG